MYPADWKPNPYSNKRYEGKEGFFVVGAASGESIDQITESRIYHKHKSYGSSPQIKELKVKGQEARLILPSSDQPVENLNLAELIIKYPTPVKIKGSTCKYFKLYASKE